MSSDPMPPYAEWEQNPNASRAGDPLWTVQAYRLSLYAVECHAADRRSFKPLAKSPVLGDLVVPRQDPLIRIRRLLLTTLRNARPKQGD